MKKVGLEKEEKNLVFKKGHYYYFVDHSCTGVENKKYVRSRNISNWDDKRIKILSLENGEEYTICEEYMLLHRILFLSEELMDKLGYKPVKSNLFKNLDKSYYCINFENEISWIIHIVKDSECYIHEKLFLSKEFGVETFQNLKDLESKSEKFKYTEDLFKILYGEKYFETTDTFVKELILEQ